jgi:hypothetical protein
MATITSKTFDIAAFALAMGKTVEEIEASMQAARPSQADLKAELERAVLLVDAARKAREEASNLLAKATKTFDLRWSDYTRAKANAEADGVAVGTAPKKKTRKSKDTLTATSVAEVEKSLEEAPKAPEEAAKAPEEAPKPAPQGKQAFQGKKKK